MKLFGVQITKAATSGPVPTRWRILEPFAGAWQRNKSLPAREGGAITYPTLYACLARIASDIAIMPFRLLQRADNGVNAPVQNAAYSPVLRRQNAYQTAQQFREAWALSKLMAGNAYGLKQRDQRGVVTGLQILDPRRVLPLVSDSGAVFYQIRGASQDLAGIAANMTVPASEIIHDRMNCLFHQLIGVPPIAAANWAAAKNMQILVNAESFFRNGAQPGGILTAPAGISDEDAKSLKVYWQTNFSGTQSGSVAVIGADAKFTPFTMKSVDAQLVEQMQYSDQQVCQAFGVPPFIVGVGSIPAGLKADDMMGVYYRFALQPLVEAMECTLGDGLSIAPPLSVQLDTDKLLRMDPETRATVMGSLTQHGIATPNDARRAFNLVPLDGGDTVYMQQQDVPLSVAAQAGQAPAPAPTPDGNDGADDDGESANEALARLWPLEIAA